MNIRIATLALLLPAAVTLPAPAQNIGGKSGIRHVLLISIDGMHAVDYLNCANGIAGVNGGAAYCPNLAALGKTGVNYTNTTTARPSDSFPGLMALVTGGSPRTVGAYYDVAYDRSLDPPAKTTGNGVQAGTCTVGAAPTGTRTEFDEGIELDQTMLNGGAPGASLTDGGVQSIDVAKLPRDPSKGCAPVYPWNFIKTNTIFGVIHGAGGFTAWSDKHASYSLVSGPGDGTNVDDYFAPEVNSTVVALPGVSLPSGSSCATILDSSQTGSWTDSFQNIQCNDMLKVNAVLNQIDGKKHNSTARTTVPNLFGMNFQAVSVGQKLIQKNVGSGGYLDANGTPSTPLLGEIQFVDAAIGAMVSELKLQGLYTQTLIIITAKHGQSPIDPARFLPIPGHSGNNGSSPATLLASMLPASESPANENGIGPTEDDISLIWLADSTKTADAVAILEKAGASAGIGQIFSGNGITALYPVPSGDPRVPDIIVSPNVGVIYTGSTKKQAEHGGFSHDDTNVMLLVSNPILTAKTLSTFVQTAQVAPTILQSLGLDPNSLQAVQIEGTAVLPGLGLQ